MSHGGRGEATRPQSRSICEPFAPTVTHHFPPLSRWAASPQRPFGGRGRERGSDRALSQVLPGQVDRQTPLETLGPADSALWGARLKWR